jgi:hypothetical protein
MMVFMADDFGFVGALILASPVGDAGEVVRGRGVPRRNPTERLLPGANCDVRRVNGSLGE